MTTRSKVLIGVLGAAAAGVVIGLLIAPEKGSDMRKKIKRTAGGWADNLVHLFEKHKDGAEEKIKHAKSAAEDKVNKIKEALT